MRIVLAGFIWFIIVGGLTLYMRPHHHASATTAPAPSALISGQFTVELTPTFSTEPDPFALQTDPSASSSPVSLKLNGQAIAAPDRLAVGEPVRIELTGITTASNELFIDASPAMQTNMPAKAHGLRVRLLRDGLPIIDQTFWSEIGGKVSGSILIPALPAKSESQPHP